MKHHRLARHRPAFHHQFAVTSLNIPEECQTLSQLLIRTAYHVLDTFQRYHLDHENRRYSHVPDGLTNETRDS